MDVHCPGGVLINSFKWLEHFWHLVVNYFTEAGNLFNLRWTYLHLLRQGGAVPVARVWLWRIHSVASPLNFIWFTILTLVFRHVYLCLLASNVITEKVSPLIKLLTVSPIVQIHPWSMICTERAFSGLCLSLVLAVLPPDLIHRWLSQLSTSSSPF